MKKVLWICNIMLPTIARQLGVSYSNREGWLSGLLERVVQERGRNRIELGIAFPVEEDKIGRASCRERVCLYV